MAKPISETPILKGKDAKNFKENMKASESTRVSEQERERIKENFEKLRSIANF